MYYFELFLKSDTTTQEDWQQLYNTIGQQAGLLNEFQIIVSLQNNTVCYFIASFKDITPLSNKLSLGIIKPSSEEALGLPSSSDSKKERLVTISAGESLLDIKEKSLIKKSKDLIFAQILIRRINKDKAFTTLKLFFQDQAEKWSLNKRRLTLFPSNLLAVDLKNNTKYLRSKIGKYLDIQKSLKIMQSENLDAIFEVYTFPYLPKNYYLNLSSYDFNKHSLIVGASGTGKSRLISLIASRISANPILQNEYSVVIIDPHASLGDNLSHLSNSVTVDFKDADQETQLFSSQDTDIQAATELTSSLFKSLLSDQASPILERVLKNSIYALITAQVMSLDNLKRLITDIEYRSQLLDHVKDHVPSNITQFFGTDFNEIRTQRYTEAISPIVSFVEEIQLQPAFNNSSDDDENSLSRLINDHSTTIFSLNKISMGEKVVKTVAGLLIQQIFLLAQARVFNKKIILVIDEVSVVQNPTIASILSEARKFNLSVILTQQYFGQVDKSLREAIFANVLNYYIFKVSEEDAKSLAGNLTISIPSEIAQSEKDKGRNIKDLQAQILTELSPREAIIQLSANGSILPAIKVKTADFEQDPANSPSKKSAVPASGPIKLDKFVEEDKSELAKPKLESNPTTEQTIPATPTNPKVAETIINQVQNPIYTHIQPAPKKVNLSVQDLLLAQSSSRKKK